MSIVYHGNGGPAMSADVARLLDLSLGKLRRQKGSRNLLFNEKFANRKKKWNQWTGNQINLTRRAFRKNNNTRRANNNNNNRNLNTNNLQTVNTSGSNWALSVGNVYEKVPNALKPRRRRL